MANWSDLKAGIAKVIRTNGAQEITGKLLQDALNSIISNVGKDSTFAGIAIPETNPGVPDGNVFYLATKAGTYVNFGGIVISDGEAVILEWRGSWIKKTTGFATQEKLSELEADTNFINPVWTIGKFWATPGDIKVGNTYEGKTEYNTAWKCCKLHIPANGVVRFDKLDRGGVIRNVVCNDNNQVVDFIEIGKQCEKTYNENVTIYISLYAKNELFKIVYFDKNADYIKNSNKYIAFDDYSAKGCYYETGNTQIGDIIDLNKFIVNNYWNTLIVSLSENDTITLFDKETASLVNKVLVVDKNTLAVKDVIAKSTKTIQYKASSDCIIINSSASGSYAKLDSSATVASIKAKADATSLIGKLTDNKIKQHVIENTDSIYDLQKIIKTDTSSEITIVKKGDGFYTPDAVLHQASGYVISEAIKVNHDECYVLHTNANSSMCAYYAADEGGNMIKNTEFYGRGLAAQPHNEYNYVFINIPKDVDYIGVSFINKENEKLKMYTLNRSIRDMIYQSQTLLATYNLKDSANEGYYLNESGNLALGNNWLTSDPIRIPSGLMILSPGIKKVPTQSGTAVTIAWYDGALNFIGGIRSEDFEYITINNKKYCTPRTIPANAVFFSACYFNHTDICLYLESIANLVEFSKLTTPIMWDDGKYITSDGLVSSNAAWKTTRPIAINYKYDYIITLDFKNGEARPCYACLYADKDLKKPIKQYLMSKGDNNTYHLNVILKKRSTPNDVKYIAFCNYKETESNLIIKYGNYEGWNDECTEEIKKEEIKAVIPKYIDVPIGRTTDIFLDGILPVYNGYPTPLRITDGIRGETLTIGNNQIKITASEEKEYKLGFEIYEDAQFKKLISRTETFIRTVLKNIGNQEEVNICLGGDSLVDGTAAPCEMYRLLKDDGDLNINQIGTRKAVMNGVTYFHEGRGGWSWGNYLDPRYESTPYEGKTNAFMFNGELNFQKYMQKYFSGKAIHIFVMSLGTNDVGQGGSIPDDKKIKGLIYNAKKFIDVLLSSDRGFPNCKVVVGMPGTGAPTFVYTKSSANIFRLSILKLNQAYVDAFDNGKYHPNVTVVAHGCYIDRYDSYQHEDIEVNDYIPRKVRRWINEVHPLEVGYKQWGFGYYSKIRAIIAGKL